MFNHVVTLISCLASLISAGSIVIMVMQYRLADRNSQVSLERDKAKMALKAIKMFKQGLKMQRTAANQARSAKSKQELIYLNDVISFIDKWAVYVNDEIASPRVIRQVLGPELKKIADVCRPVVLLQLKSSPKSLNNYLKLMARNHDSQRADNGDLMKINPRDVQKQLHKMSSRDIVRMAQNSDRETQGIWSDMADSMKE